MDPKEIVRRGYDALSYRYREDAEEPARYATWLEQLLERVPAGGAVLDLGCGCGVLLGRIGRWLRPGGWLLATTGERAWTGAEDGWLGGDTPMWWSHADAATYRAWTGQAGLTVGTQEVVPGAGGSPALFWARRPHDGRAIR